MKFLQQFIADLQYPVFITRESSPEIQFANSIAVNKAGKPSLDGTSLDDSVKRYPTLLNGRSYGQYLREWYEIKERAIKNGDCSYLVTELSYRDDLPFGESFENWKKMVEVMLHRLRSPLTGIAGYLEMMEEENTNKDLEKRFSPINKGFDQVFDIMDELEELYQLDNTFDDEGFTEISPQQILQETTDLFSEEARQRFQFQNPQPDLTILSDPEPLRLLLRQLLENALRHSDGDISISLNPQNPVTITIENEARDITPEITEKAFFPFVTSRADDLGIGLTTALLQANRIGATLFFEHKEEKIAVSLVFPFQ